MSNKRYVHLAVIAVIAAPVEDAFLTCLPNPILIKRSLQKGGKVMHDGWSIKLIYNLLGLLL